MSHAFGRYFGRLRREHLELSLREFCARKDLDPGNMSKLERGKIPPPRSREVLKKYAHALELEEGTDEWLMFFDLAAASRGELPEDLAEDEEVLDKLPALFRTLRGDRVDEDKLDELVDLIRGS